MAGAAESTNDGFRLGVERSIGSLMASVNSLQDNYENLHAEVRGLRKQIWYLILAALVGPWLSQLHIHL